MTKDKRFKTVKLLIESNNITNFSDIFEHIPKTVIAKHLGTNYNRLSKLVDNVDLFSLRDLFRLARFFEVDDKVMLDLAFTQYSEKKAKLSKTAIKKKK
jgi:hypothetical protein